MRVLSPQTVQIIHTWKEANDSYISHWKAQADYPDQDITLIANIYTAILGRQAEEDGARNWLDHVQQGMPARSLAIF